MNKKDIEKLDNEFAYKYYKKRDSLRLEIRKLFFIRPANLDDANDVAKKGMKMIDELIQFEVDNSY